MEARGTNCIPSRMTVGQSDSRTVGQSDSLEDTFITQFPSRQLPLSM